MHSFRARFVYGSLYRLFLFCLVQDIHVSRGKNTTLANNNTSKSAKRWTLACHKRPDFSISHESSQVSKSPVLADAGCKMGIFWGGG